MIPLVSISCTRVLKGPDSLSIEALQQQHISTRVQNRSIKYGSTALKVAVQKFQKWVIEEYLRLADRPYFISAHHDVEIPIGFGLGSSGAAALSLSYTLNQALDIGLSRTQAAQIAHHAEIACNTGLGTVIAEFAGGFEMRTGVGAPGIGSVSKINLDKDYKALVLCLAPILTKSFLTNRINEIDGLGGTMLSKLLASKALTTFSKCHIDFAEMLNLTEGRCKGPIQALKTRELNQAWHSLVRLFSPSFHMIR